MSVISAVEKNEAGSGDNDKGNWADTCMEITVILRITQKARLTCFGKGSVTEEEDGWNWGQRSGGGGAKSYKRAF